MQYNEKNIIEITDNLRSGDDLNIRELLYLIEQAECEYFFKVARKVCEETFGNTVYLRALIEFSNFCKSECLYCGINKTCKIRRYRMNKDEIIDACGKGYAEGARTFVLQSGEDEYFDEENMCEIIKGIKKEFSDCAVTLSCGEKAFSTYKKYREAGCDRYLLRHESSDAAHYSILHNDKRNLSTRIKCLNDLKKLKFQTGAGFMVGSPYQTTKNLAEEIIFLKKLNPEMVGIGPFIPSENTFFKNQEPGSALMTLKMVALCRIVLPKALIPATTALGTIKKDGRIAAVKAGANVVMVNFTPDKYRSAYSLYDGKICKNDEQIDEVSEIKQKLTENGFSLSFTRGDSPFYKIN